MEDIQTPSTCSMDGCDRPVFCRGWCSAHYSRWRRHGDPTFTTRQPPQVNVAEKRCPRCSKVKQIDQFGLRPNGKPRGYCRECDAAYLSEYAATPNGKERRRVGRSRWNESNHDYFLRYRYGITAEDYANLLDMQGGCCAICGTDTPGGRDKVWHVDHCHDTLKVRGLLCGLCNRGLGQFKDDLDRLRSAVAYLELHERS